MSVEKCVTLRQMRGTVPRLANNEAKWGFDFILGVWFEAGVNFSDWWRGLAAMPIKKQRFSVVSNRCQRCGLEMKVTVCCN
jgi:hypothetical protein